MKEKGLVIESLSERRAVFIKYGRADYFFVAAVVQWCSGQHVLTGAWQKGGPRFDSWLNHIFVLIRIINLSDGKSTVTVAGQTLTPCIPNFAKFFEYMKLILSTHKTCFLPQKTYELLEQSLHWKQFKQYSLINYGFADAATAIGSVV